MSYRCETCNGVVPHGTPRATHVVCKPGTRQTERELAVCGGCKHALATGAELPEWTGRRKWVEHVEVTVHRDDPTPPAAGYGDDVPLV